VPAFGLAAGASTHPAFYSYAYPTPEGFSSAAMRPAAPFFSPELGEFILPYFAIITVDASVGDTIRAR
jgi:hypothetical protein